MTTINRGDTAYNQRNTMVVMIIEALPSLTFAELNKMNELIVEWKNNQPELVGQIQVEYETEGVIPAIKRYHEVTGLGLIESKDWVEKSAIKRGWKKYEYKRFDSLGE